MSRPGGGLRQAAALGATLVVVAASGCSSTDADNGCRIERQSVFASTALTMTPDARLDAVGDGFVLFGSSGSTVRWAALSIEGTLGPERSVEVPTHVAGPWVAAAGASTPGDTVLVIYATRPADVTPGNVRLEALPVPADGGPARAPVPIVEVADPTAGALLRVAALSSRPGFRAGLAYGVRGQTELRALALRADGQPVAAALTVSEVAEFECVGFVPGRSALTLGHLVRPADGAPSWTIFEMNDAGDYDSAVTLTFGAAVATCPVQTPSEVGYGLSWQNDTGSWLGQYDVAANRFTIEQVVTASTFGGADLQPPIEGLAAVARGYGLLFRRLKGGEVWRFDLRADRVPGALVLPSLTGNVGAFSSVPVSGALYTTYPDLASDEPGADGQRDFLRIACD